MPFDVVILDLWKNRVYVSGVVIKANVFNYKTSQHVLQILNSTLDGHVSFSTSFTFSEGAFLVNISFQPHDCLSSQEFCTSMNAINDNKAMICEQRSQSFRASNVISYVPLPRASGVRLQQYAGLEVAGEPFQTPPTCVLVDQKGEPFPSQDHNIVLEILDFSERGCDCGNSGGACTESVVDYSIGWWPQGYGEQAKVSRSNSLVPTEGVVQWPNLVCKRASASCSR